jgi:hypothetical protein
VFLIPLQMKRKGKELSAIEVQVASEPQVNPVLLPVLAEQTGIQISESELVVAVAPTEREAGSAEESTELTALDNYQRALHALAARVKGMPEFKTELSATISNFSLQSWPW